MAISKTVGSQADGWIDAQSLGFAPGAEAEEGWQALDAGAADVAAGMDDASADEVRAEAAALTPEVVERGVAAVGDEGWLSVADDRLDLDLALKTMAESEPAASDAAAGAAATHEHADAGYSVTDSAAAAAVPVDESSFS